MAGNRLRTSPTFCTMASMRKLVRPANSTKSMSAMEQSTLSSDRRRIPFSTPVSTETAAMITDRAMRQACTARPSGIPNMKSKPKLSWATPMPSVVAMPKIVPRTAAMSTAWTMGPWMRLPKIGCRAERMLSGRLWR